MSLLDNQFFQKISWQASVTLVYVFVAFIQSIVLARFLGVFEFGVFATVFGISVITSQLFDPRFLDFLIKFLTKYEIENNQQDSFKLATSCWIISLILVGLACFIFYLLDSVFTDIFFGSESEYTYLFPLALFSTFTSTHFFTIFQAVFRAKGLIKELSIFSISFHLLRLFTLISYLIFFEASIFGALVSLFLVNFIFLLLMYIIMVGQYSNIKRYRGLNFSYPDLGSEGNIIYSLYFTSIASVPQKEMDIFFLGIFTKPETVGLYRMAKNFTVAIWAVVDGMVLLLFPEIVKMRERGEWDKLKALIKRILYIGLALSFLIVICGYMFLPFLIEILLSEEFKESYYFAMILFTGAFFWLPLTWVYPYAVSINFAKVIAFSTLFSGILTTFLYTIFVYSFSSYGVSFIYALSPGLASLLLLLGLIHSGGFQNIVNESNLNN